MRLLWKWVQRDNKSHESIVGVRSHAKTARGMFATATQFASTRRSVAGRTGVVEAVRLGELAVLLLMLRSHSI